MPGAAELVNWAVGGTLEPGTTADLGETILRDQAIAERLERMMSPDAVVEFATPDGGFVGEMAGPFAGPDGLRRGWAEWLEPWESFTYRPTELLELPGGKVLTLGECTACLAESGVEVDTAVGALYTVREGRIVRVEHFLDQAQARAAAGLP